MTLRVVPALLALLTLVVVEGATDRIESQRLPAAEKGGDDRNGAYDAVPN